MDNQAIGKNGRIPSTEELNEYAKEVIEGQKTYSIIVALGFLFAGLLNRPNVPKVGFKVEGELKTIFNNRGLFLNWLKGNQSLARQTNPLNATEAQQLIDVAKSLGLTTEHNLSGLLGTKTIGPKKVSVRTARGLPIQSQSPKCQLALPAF